MGRGKNSFFSTDVQTCPSTCLLSMRLCRWTHPRNHRLKCLHVKVTFADRYGQRIAAGRKGRVEVIFNIDAIGILNVSAQDKSSLKANQITSPTRIRL